jgi:hypothetical protein
MLITFSVIAPADEEKPAGLDRRCHLVRTRLRLGAAVGQTNQPLLA